MLAHHSPFLLSPPLLSCRLGAAQWALLSEVNKLLQDEYAQRTELLLRRLDVTVQSCRWSARMKARCLCVCVCLS